MRLGGRTISFFWSTHTDVHKNAGEESFRTVVRKKRSLCIGKKSASNLKTVKSMQKPIQLFATRFHPDTAAEDIESFVKAQFEKVEDALCSSLTTKYNSYASFKITLRGILLHDCLDMEKRPEGILVKKFFLPPLPTKNLTKKLLGPKHNI